MQIRVVPGVCRRRINLSRALAPSPGSKLFYICTKTVLSPPRAPSRLPVTLPAGGCPLEPRGVPCPGCGRGWGWQSRHCAKLRWFCPQRPMAHLGALKESFSLPCRKLSTMSPLRQKSLPFTPFVRAFFCQGSFFKNSDGEGFLFPPFFLFLVIT